jgi:hypothetical protein
MHPWEEEDGIWSMIEARREEEERKKERKKEKKRGRDD